MVPGTLLSMTGSHLPVWKTEVTVPEMSCPMSAALKAWECSWTHLMYHTRRSSWETEHWARQPLMWSSTDIPGSFPAWCQLHWLSRQGVDPPGHWPILGGSATAGHGHTSPATGAEVCTVSSGRTVAVWSWMTQGEKGDSSTRSWQGYLMYIDHTKCSSAGQTSVVLDAFLCSQVCNVGLGTCL